jgi:hypothetical protein
MGNDTKVPPYGWFGRQPPARVMTRPVEPLTRCEHAAGSNPSLPLPKPPTAAGSLFAAPPSVKQSNQPAAGTDHASAAPINHRCSLHTSGCGSKGPGQAHHSHSGLLRSAVLGDVQRFPRRKAPTRGPRRRVLAPDGGSEPRRMVLETVSASDPESAPVVEDSRPCRSRHQVRDLCWTRLGWSYRLAFLIIQTIRRDTSGPSGSTRHPT